jgi:hypothetical protein
VKFHHEGAGSEQDEAVEGPALNDPATNAALRDYRGRSLRVLGIAVALLAVAVVAVQQHNGHPTGFRSFIGTVGFGVGFVLVYMGASGTHKTSRARRLMKHEPWQRRQVTYRIVRMGAYGQPALLFKADDTHAEAVCSLSVTVWRYRQLPQGSDQPVLVVGDPRHWCVVAPLDRRVLIVAKRPVVPLWRSKLRRYALEQ